jgi:hypothetical protein
MHVSSDVIEFVLDDETLGSDEIEIHNLDPKVIKLAEALEKMLVGKPKPEEFQFR